MILLQYLRPQILTRTPLYRKVASNPLGYRTNVEICAEDELSEYELERHKNMIANQEFMMKCGKSDYTSPIFSIIVNTRRKLHVFL